MPLSMINVKTKQAKFKTAFPAFSAFFHQGLTPPPPDSDREIRLLLGPVAAMRGGQPGIRRNCDTFLILDLHGMFEAGYQIFLSAVPSTWLTPIIRGHSNSTPTIGIVSVEYIVAVYCHGSGFHDSPTRSKHDHMAVYFQHENGELPVEYG